MAEITVKTKLFKFNLSTKTKSKLADVLRSRVQKRLGAITENMKGIVRYEIEAATRRNIIFKRLVGEESGIKGYDLAAEFGLSKADAKVGGETIIAHLKETVDIAKDDLKIEYRKDPAKLKITIQIGFLQPQKYRPLILADKSLEYTTHSLHVNKKGKVVKKRKKKGQISYQVRWAKWLIEANKGIETIVQDLPRIAGYGIMYDLSPSQRLLSRSGRALMKQVDIRGSVLKGDVEVGSGTVTERISGGSGITKKTSKGQRPEIDISKRTSVKSFAEQDALESMADKWLAEAEKKAGKTSKQEDVVKPKRDRSARGAYKYPAGARPDSGQINFVEEIKTSGKMKNNINKKIATLIRRYVSRNK